MVTRPRPDGQGWGARIRGHRTRINRGHPAVPALTAGRAGSATLYGQLVASGPVRCRPKFGVWTRFAWCDQATRGEPPYKDSTDQDYTQADPNGDLTAQPSGDGTGEYRHEDQGDRPCPQQDAE